jgi:enterochelin esterase-like enzyme
MGWGNAKDVLKYARQGEGGISAGIERPEVAPMKKFLIAFIFLLGLGLAGIGGWLLNATHESRAAAEQYQEWAQSQKMAPIQFQISVPKETPADQTLFISGDESALGSWDAAGVPLHRQADGTYTGAVSLLSGIAYKFKVTRGTWGTVERGASGAEIDDHSFIADPSAPVTVQVQTWVDGGKSVPGKVTLTGNFRLHKKFESALLGNQRTIIVYLPPGYDANPDQRYPVLYMQDGQNLFDSSTAFAGVEWQVDENAQDLISSGKISPVIIVGIYNTPDRTAEYTPFDQTPSGEPGKEKLYGRFVVEELKPMIDSTYRTQPGRGSTAIAGASLGGMAALAVAHDHPDVFGAVAVLDPWLRDSRQSLLDGWKDDSWMKGMRIYADMGTSGGSLYPGTTEVQDFNQLTASFDAAGLVKGKDYTAAVIDGAEHNERAWQKRIGGVLTFLYGK